MDDTPILKRPKPTDGEEELMRMQEEFLRNKQEPSAKVINLRHLAKNDSKPHETQLKEGKKKSRFSELKRLKTKERVSTSQTGGEVINPAIKERVDSANRLQDSIHNVPVTGSNIILGNIVEKKYDTSMYDFEANKRFPVKSEGGFPGVFVSENMKTNGNHSLFWQQVSQTERISTNEENAENSKTMEGNDRDIGGSNVVEGSWAVDIHRENMERLSQMTQEEILQEKNKLEAMLKPELIQFLKDRKNKKQQTKQTIENNKQSDISNDNQHMIIDEAASKQESVLKDDQGTPMQVDEEQEKIPDPPKEIMEQAKKKGWVHMDSVEPEKLKWMEDLPPEKTDGPPPDEPYNARFDFNGLLLPYKDENLTVEKGLHHHGEEPERPGYSLQELLQLSRSSAQQQRCTALTTLGNIIEKSRKGWYDKALQPAPLTALSQRNVLLLLRFSLDDTSVAIVTATLQALRAFLYSEADEVCLDRLFGFDNTEPRSYKEPVLSVPKNDVSDTNNLKDHELAQLDAVAALLRSDIVLRIRYVLSQMHPPPIGVNCAFEILTRLVRHSHITAINIACTPHLLEMIVENFMPLSTCQLAAQDTIDNAYGVPVTTAVRFCRILVCYGGKAVAERLERLKVVQSVISYVSCDAGRTGINLSIESLRLWKILLQHGVATDSLSGAQLTLVSQLQLFLSNHDLQSASELSCEYAAALISVAADLASLTVNISVLLSKWSTQLLSLNEPTWARTKLVAETLLALKNTTDVGKLTISRTRVFSRLGSTSNLLSDCTPATDREPSSLPNLGVLTQNGELQPIVSHHSCIPFLSTTINVFLQNSLLAELEAILNHRDFFKYLKRLEKADWSLERCWYTRTELFLLVSVVKATHLFENKLNNEICHVVWKIGVKLVSALPADFSNSVNDVLGITLARDRMNLELVANELSKLNLNSKLELVEKDLSVDVASIYGRYVKSSDEWEQAAMPKDWLYLPLVHLYSRCKNNEACNEQDKASILTLLTLELILPDLLDGLTQSLRFSRLVLVYLCDTLYLSEDVSALLSRVMSTLLKNHYERLNFNDDLPGLSSFTDLFTSMCEHFSSTSYGDHGFSMVLLVPVAQRHDVHYRKLLWSEHAGLLRYLRLPVKEMVVPLKEYLYPLEEDSSLIESYMTALVRGIINETWCPVPYTIAFHHSAMYLKGSSKLACRMRKQVEKLPNKPLSYALLSYEPPTL